MITDYHAKLFAHELYRRYPSDHVERFTATLMESQVDLNPHQVDAALFAFRSPFSKGAILADEVGLGKTIEAGIVLSQKWAERKRKILIIMPASLRKQWSQELLEKFHLPSVILEAASFNKAIKNNISNPFSQDKIVICSFQFANNKAKNVRAIDWDLVVIDEAHRLRNVYKKGNKIAHGLKDILHNAPKMLLTATPLQNSLLELFGLVSFISEHTFGDIKTFTKEFAGIPTEESFNELKERLKPLCKRTLRSQVLEYINYTDRTAYTQEFVPTAEEQELYDMVSGYLQRPNLRAIQDSQLRLMTIVLRKLLASSTAAIAPALDSFASRLQRLLDSDYELSEAEKALRVDFETFEELADEIEVVDGQKEFEVWLKKEREIILGEIDDLRRYSELAKNISINAKGESLLKALEVGFKMTAELGGPAKAIIFTESCRTQQYLAKLLSKAGYKEDIVLFNGSNSDAKSRKIYTDWKNRYQGTDIVSGSRAAGSRAALVDYFRETAKIMIATEAAAEGINLQFCSMVVNYDLPWNPQRIEQRIGRCHRYGQEHDVVVVNFLNKNNAADQRVYQLLSEKFKLFNGVFGASDEVLGLVESGVDFQRRIIDIYQTCRTRQEIQASFDALQKELATEIHKKMLSARHKLLEQFDDEVAEKLNVYRAAITTSLNKHETLLWNTTRYLLNDSATFDDSALSFELHQSPNTKTIPTGRYVLKRGDMSGYHYRPQHPLAMHLLKQAMEKKLPVFELAFQYSKNPEIISTLEPFIGKNGTMTAKQITVSAVDSEDYVIVAAVTDDGKELDSEQSRRLFDLPSYVNETRSNASNKIVDSYKKRKDEILSMLAKRNAVFFKEEADKINRWAEDKHNSLKTILTDYDDKALSLKNQARSTQNLPEMIDIEKRLIEIENKRAEAWGQYKLSTSNIENQKNILIDKVHQRLKQLVQEKPIFTVRWRLI